MALPETEPVDVVAVKALSYVGNTLTPDDEERLSRIVAAVNGSIRELPVSDRADGALTWPARIVEGGVMLAGRLFRRKDTPAGVSVMGDGVAVYVRRNDPDIAFLLELDDHSKPAIA